MMSKRLIRCFIVNLQLVNFVVNNTIRFIRYDLDPMAWQTRYCSAE